MEPMELLTDGRAAFPEILRCLRAARESVEINMFIWRNDRIGRAMAEEVLAAADRGVKIVLSKDRYGVICESCEENRLSLFHRSPTLWERTQIAALKVLYNREAPPPEPDPAAVRRGDELLAALRNHPNVSLEERYKYDHSKFCLIDGRTLILGGINVEDKENGCDLAGRQYADYMVKITDPPLLAAFREMREHPASACRSIPADTPFFMLNRKETADGAPFFGMKEAYLRLIDEAEESLAVVMAYLSPLPEFEAAFLRAARRGVKLRFLIPASANFQDDLNKKTVLRLHRKSEGRISVFLYPGMNHTKLLLSEKQLTVGSCNITKKAFGQLDELNLFVPAGRPGTAAFEAELRQSAEARFAVSAPADETNLRCRRLFAAMESLVM